MKPRLCGPQARWLCVRVDRKVLAVLPSSLMIACIHPIVPDRAWQTWGDVKADFGTVSLVGNCVVFNIGGNKYRLVTQILYPSQKVFILKVMTHAEYDLNKWKDDCGCFEPPPAKSVGSIKLPPA